MMSFAAEAVSMGPMDGCLLLQITNAPRSSGKDITELHQYILEIVRRINGKYGSDNHQPVSSTASIRHMLACCPRLLQLADCSYHLTYQTCRSPLPASDHELSQQLHQYITCFTPATHCCRSNTWSATCLCTSASPSTLWPTAQW